MTLEEVMEKDARYVMPTYGRLPIAFVRGEGVYLWDTQGRRYLDFLGGIAVAGLGHAHPRLVRAIAEQAAKLLHTSNLYYIPPQAELAQRLVERSCFDKVFFCNSGAEANEAAIKNARRYGKMRWGEEGGRYEILTARNSFHGRTLATLTATGQEKVHKGFEPLVEGFRYFEFNNLESVRAALSPRTCAILVEPIQGESGVHVATEEFLQGLRHLCHEEGLLLIVDEVQTGMGRTGKWFAYQHYGIEPDAMTLAKSLGGGVPIGAFLAKKETIALTPSSHASTFGGNFLACAAGCAVIDAMEEEGLVENAARMGEAFQEGLRELQRKHGCIREVRGKGLMVAAELNNGKAVEVQNRCREAGLILNAIGENILRFLPPLVVREEHLQEALSILDSVLGAVG